MNVETTVIEEDADPSISPLACYLAHLIERHAFKFQGLVLVDPGLESNFKALASRVQTVHESTLHPESWLTMMATY